MAVTVKLLGCFALTHAELLVQKWVNLALLHLASFRLT